MSVVKTYISILYESLLQYMNTCNSEIFLQDLTLSNNAKITTKWFSEVNINVLNNAFLQVPKFNCHDIISKFFRRMKQLILKITLHN